MYPQLLFFAPFAIKKENSMHIREYQEWLREWDAARGWDKLLPSHVMLHAMEELGEVSKLVQMVEGYREPNPANLDAVRDLLALELSDLQVMLFKIAILCDIDMEDALRKGMAKADARFPDIDASRRQSAEAWERFRAYLTSAGLPTLPDLDTESRRDGDTERSLNRG